MPVVMMSGHGTIDTAVEATRMGAAGYLEKPVPLQKLLTTVGRALRGGQVKPSMTLPLASLGRGPLIADLKKRLEQVVNLEHRCYSPANPEPERIFAPVFASTRTRPG